MSQNGQPYLLSLLSGKRRGAGACALRGALRLAEPFYSGGMALRNQAYDRGVFPVRRLGAAAISVGNITAGGTGKTPVVQWLAARMKAAGSSPAILLRGYKSAGGQSDEAEVLRESLNPPGEESVIVQADPDRVASANGVLARNSKVDLFILDDAYQHRRAYRDFDLVLIDATNPFGFGHVHPRGLLREPLSGLARADAFVLTRSDQVSADECRAIEVTLRSYNHLAPVYRARHAHAGLRSRRARACEPPDVQLSAMASRRFYTVSGIANPSGLEQQLRFLPGMCAGMQWFGDHHPFSPDDMMRIGLAAQQAGADMLLMTEKDWTKVRHHLAALPAGLDPYRLALEIQFEKGGEAGLLDYLQTRLEKKRRPAPNLTESLRNTVRLCAYNRLDRTCYLS